MTVPGVDMYGPLDAPAMMDLFALPVRTIASQPIEAASARRVSMIWGMSSWLHPLSCRASRMATSTKGRDGTVVE
jgi:hypothetical protein